MQSQSSGIDDELAAFENEMKALESGGAAAAPAPQPRIIAAAPTIISAAPVLGRPQQPPVIDASGKRLPVSEWASPGELVESLRAEGAVLPVQLTAPSSMPQPPPPTASFIEANTFIGPKPGYVFKSGPRGLGYYKEAMANPYAPPSTAVSSFPAPGSEHMAPRGGAGSSSHGAAASQGSSSSHAGQRNISRTVAGMVWEDKSLLDWPEDDFRVFVGNLGNEVNDDVLSHAFQKYASFQMARVVRDRQSTKTRGFGFVSFKDPWDMTKALREMQGKYVGNRPIQLRKSTAGDRAVTGDNQPLQFNHALAVSDKSTKRKFEKGHAVHKEPTWKGNKKKNKHLPW